MGDNVNAVEKQAVNPSSDIDGNGDNDTLEREQGNITEKIGNIDNSENSRDKEKNSEIEDENDLSNDNEIEDKVALLNESQNRNQNEISAEDEKGNGINENEEELPKNNDVATVGEVPIETEEERETRLNREDKKEKDGKRNDRSIGEKNNEIENKTAEDTSVATSNEKELIKSDKVEDKQSQEKKNVETKPETSKTGKTESKKATNPQSTPKSGEENPIAIVSSSKKSRPPYRFDPNKITVRFLFANRDGLTVTVECKPNDTVGEVKGALISVWPEDLPNCAGGDSIRLVCMGKGLLMPDSRTLEDCQVPVFKTHPTPVNVSIKPDLKKIEANQKGKDGNINGNNSVDDTPSSSQGCACIIL